NDERSPPIGGTTKLIVVMEGSSPAYRQAGSRIHYFLLVIDTFHMHRVKILHDKLLAQAVLLSFRKCFFNNLVPPVCLQDRDIIFFFILPDLFRDQTGGTRLLKKHLRKERRTA